MGRARASFVVFLLFALVFCANVAIVFRWIAEPSAISAFPLLGVALATLNVLGLVLLGRVLVALARTFYAHYKEDQTDAARVNTAKN